MRKYKYLSVINSPADLKRLPKEAMEELSEEGIKNGGAGMLLSSELSRLIDIKSKIIAINDAFVSRPDEKTVYEAAGLSPSDIANVIEELL